jgi:hypothetical protein
VSAALRSAGSRRPAVAGSRARALAALASAEITGARSEREHWEKGLGRDILANCERKGVDSCRQRLRAAAFCISTGLLVCWRRRRRRRLLSLRRRRRRRLLSLRRRRRAPQPAAAAADAREGGFGSDFINTYLKVVPKKQHELCHTF